MSVPLSLRRFAAGLKLTLAVGVSQSFSSSLISRDTLTSQLWAFFLAEGGVYLGRGVRSPWPEVAVL